MANVKQGAFLELKFVIRELIAKAHYIIDLQDRSLYTFPAQQQGCLINPAKALQILRQGT
jgi:hypothetical protein